MTGTVVISTHRLPFAGRLRDAFQEEGYRVDLAPDPAHLEVVQEPVLLVVTGERAEGELEEWLATAQEQLEIPVFTALPGETLHMRGRRAGVEEMFGPEPDPDDVVLLGHRMVQRRRLQRVTGIVGESESIREALERVVQIAPVDSTVLITGESGTGKELVARGIHALSARRHRSFLAVNVAALSETLLESELFGHEKGSFTGAIDSRKGFFELAHRGTLFLDEIGEMPPSTQTKLLRVLEQGEFLRVGGEKPIEVDVRIIAATNQELRSLIPTGGFRRDLYYRLNILGIELPPLRRRRDDIPRLIHHFVRELTRKMDRPFPGLTDQAMELLVRHDWPGNVRELRNLVESMVVLSPGRVIGPGDIPLEIRTPGAGGRLLPVPISGLEHRADDGEVESASRIRPELEFVFRTLVELRMDMDQLRREFERYRSEAGEWLEAPSRRSLALPPYREEEMEVSARREAVSAADPGSSGPAEAEEEPPLHLPRGMTMEDLEREAIRQVLREVDGNRRKAAERLGIGERTLYRKIGRYGIEP